MTVNLFKHFVRGWLKIKICNLTVKEILVRAKLKCSNLIIAILFLCFTVICVREVICLCRICVVKTFCNALCVCPLNGTFGDIAQVAEGSGDRSTGTRET